MVDETQSKVIRRSDKVIAHGFYEKKWIAQGKLAICPRHRKFPDDPRITYIMDRVPWWFIKGYLWDRVTAPSQEELQKSIDEIYGRQVKDDERFFLHFGNFK